MSATRVTEVRLTVTLDNGNQYTRVLTDDDPELRAVRNAHLIERSFNNAATQMVDLMRSMLRREYGTFNTNEAMR